MDGQPSIMKGRSRLPSVDATSGPVPWPDPSEEPATSVDGGIPLGRWAARATIAAVIATWLVAMVVTITANGGADPASSAVAGSASLLALTAALLATRRPHNALLWVLVASGICVTLGVAGLQEPDPGDRAAISLGYLANGLFFVGLALFVSFFALLYPDGSVPGRGWRVVGWVAAAGTVVAGSWAMLVEQDVGPGYPPFGMLADDSVLAGVFGFGGVLVAVAVVGGLVALVVRYRRGSLDLRRRMRVPMYAVLIWLPIFVVVNVVFEREWIGETFGGVINLALPVLLTASLVVAVTRHGLYEIDRIVSRTVSYTIVVGLLAGVYAAGFALLTRVLPSDSDLAVAASTLAAVGLFTPVRRRVQTMVDRRFDRQRYRADRVVEEFGGRLRSGADLESIPSSLEEVIRDTLHPSMVAVWIRTRSS